ncbi:hypothetical protein L1049_000374 [Liquidambar formosana]|uniref:Uncharacterized protein n=1 Tax=Liquidambar formosana TaxID=63359 RepID=A0AAP0R2Q3_LIQFO
MSKKSETATFRFLSADDFHMDQVAVDRRLTVTGLLLEDSYKTRSVWLGRIGGKILWGKKREVFSEFFGRKMHRDALMGKEEMD